jgi:hypothetical protein
MLAQVRCDHPRSGIATRREEHAGTDARLSRIRSTGFRCLDFPLLLIARLPRFLKRDDFAAGILSGRLAFSHTLRNPELIGDAQLIDGRFAITRASFSASAASCSRGKSGN